jgi:hypothetical protein
MVIISSLCPIPRLSISRLTILWLRGTGPHHGGVGIAGLMAGSTIAACSGGGGKLGVAGSVLVAVALPEGGSAGAGGVVVGGGGAVALLFLVVADQEDLEDGG